MKKSRKLRLLKIQLKRADNKASIIIYFIVRALIILCLVRQLMHANYYNVLLCLLSLVLIFIPTFIERKTKIRLPSALEISVMLFVFAAEILGEIESFYIHIPIWDLLLHTTNGFLAAAVGFGFIDLLNTKAKRTHMAPIFVALVAFCTSMTVGVLWEFFEYGADRILKTDMQKDAIVTTINSTYIDETKNGNVVKIDGIDHTVIYGKDDTVLAVIEDGYLDPGLNDTIEDMFVNMIGAFVFSVFGYLYLIKTGKYRFIENFLISSDEPK